MNTDNTSEKIQRIDELKLSLVRLSELMEIRNSLLTYLEKNIFRKIKDDAFSRLNVKGRNVQLSTQNNIKRNYELDIRTLRRNLFYLRKRKQFLELELAQLQEMTASPKADLPNPSL